MLRTTIYAGRNGLVQSSKFGRPTSELGHEQQISDGRCDVGFSRKRPSAAAWHPAALGPTASFRTAEKQRAFSPLDHREVGHRPADWGVIFFLNLPRA